MTARFFVDAAGNYLGGWAGSDPPAGAIEVPDAPDDARQVWSNGAWGAIPVAIPDHVSARQFRIQLRRSGLLDQVKTWVATQSLEVQDAFEFSGSFVRSEPMMQAGFTALGFTPAQIDTFFLAASKL